VAQGVISTLGAVNEQDAIQKIQSDPAAVEKVKQVVQDLWWQIDTSGAAAAGERDIKFVATGRPVWTSPSFLAMVIMTPMVYLVLGAVIGLYGNLHLSNEVAASIITAVVSIVAAGCASYYWGSTTKANQPTAPAQQ
jgi:hypothetical protein